MKIFAKKADSESLRTLNEKEIQKRLYGRYHLDTSSKITPPKTNNYPPHLEVPKFTKPVALSTRWKAFALRFQGVLATASRKFPWKFSIIVIAALTLSVILLQILSIWFGKVKTSTLPETPVTNATEPVVSSKRIRAAEPSKIVKKEVKKAEVSSTSVLSPATTAESEISTQKLESPKKKYYAVQVCTFQREQDAERLANELKGSNFDAFYLRMGSSQQRQPHYVVFLGKAETYAAANSKLNTFRKTRYFEQFSDSYIRSI